MSNPATDSNVIRKSKEMIWPKVIMFGDSMLKRGFTPISDLVGMLAKKLDRRCEITDRAFNGYNTRWICMLLNSIFPPASLKNVEAVIISFGSNDCCDPDMYPNTAVPLAEYKRNLKAIVSYFQHNGIDPKRIITVGVSYVHYPVYKTHCLKLGMQATPSNERLCTYNNAFREVAAELKIDFIDIHEEIKKQKDPEQYIGEDGAHLSLKGVKLVSSLVWPALKLRTNHLPEIYPYYDNVNFRRPEESFKKYLLSKL